MENQIRELPPKRHRSSSVNNDDNNPAQDQNQPEEPIALLPELWTKIFLYLWDKEEDLESLESCRFVSHQFQQLVDNLPLKPDRNPWFKFYHQRYPFLSPLYHARATEFVSDEDVINFLKETPSPESDAFGCSPFHRHQTVKLHKFSDNLIMEGRNFGMIFQQHGKHIKKLIYLPNKFPNAFSNLSRLMTTMTNLQTLVVDLSLLHADRRQALRGEEIPNDLNIWLSW
ncbi:hypothetical protein Ocin01_19409 [Orchesella cincta]|uniref:F-box domain-containing protein n=1 Tax=Orchesella cincta TaxID=48709 RepID=A0A1D2M2S8_ORCCI|nr:hypothetical protein Ocin01_19409 [Orchesella cincta]